MRAAAVIVRPCVAYLLLTAGGAAYGAADAGALAQWNACVKATESQLWRGDAAIHGHDLTTSAAMPQRAVVEASTVGACQSKQPSSDTIQQWRGRLFLRGGTLDQLLYSLQHVLPAQDDVVAARFIDREPDRVRVYLRIVRRTILTVTFDTEHEMTFARVSTGVATAGSVMTRVDEVDSAGTARERIVPPDADRGLLWRLQSYFRYTQTAGGVLIEMQSLTLSRGIPLLLRPVAGPIVDHVARESAARTLDALAARFDGDVDRR